MLEELVVSLRSEMIFLNLPKTSLPKCNQVASIRLRFKPSSSTSLEYSFPSYPSIIVGLCHFSIAPPLSPPAAKRRAVEKFRGRRWRNFVDRKRFQVSRSEDRKLVGGARGGWKSSGDRLRPSRRAIFLARPRPGINWT